ncbi:DUF4145 domain-containing protein [Phenylobacterium sp.]|uniref:DUF4145 domain-containing protein n=1 Tax=Phenylobacterium sp. TaxID=1871053 RepID=UPI0028110029|nr:DUF4145 domain-containing protein [Phenylobacterium sp.]
MTEATDVALRCPHCRHTGVFFPVQDGWDTRWWESVGDDMEKRAAGARVCPNQDCGGIVLVVMHEKELVESFPPEMIDFDATALPERLLATLEEAARCHAAGAYRACALMVRRLLEELCDDRKADGANLKARLSSLGSANLVPTELLEAADELRILGNDAAHIDGKSYDNIGADECEAALELAKELLKAVYQYNALLDRLRALKKSRD